MPGRVCLLREQRVIPERTPEKAMFGVRASLVYTPVYPECSQYWEIHSTSNFAKNYPRFTSALRSIIWPPLTYGEHDNGLA